MPAPPPNQKIVYLWVDLETTGLRPHDNEILEAAWGFTDRSLVELGQVSHAYVRRPNFVWKVVDPAVLRMHTENGLLLDWTESDNWLSPREVGEEILHEIRDLGSPTVQLAGSGVHFDREWIEFWIPDLYQVLSYRIGLDVSQQERFLRDVCGLELPARPVSEHRAMGDVLDSLLYAREIRDLIDRMATSYKARQIIDEEEAIDE